MIIVAGGVKGGTGKSTAAVHLAIHASKQGCDVLLVDADDQETSTDFSIIRADAIPNAGYTAIKLTGQAVRTQLVNLASKYDTIVVDTGGRDTTSQRAALSVADILIAPFNPRSLDIWTLERVEEVVVTMRTINPTLKAIAYINRADPRGKDNAEAADAIRESGLEYLDATVGNRKAISNALAQGLSVSELKPRDTRAAGEIEYLCDEVLRRAA